MSTWHILFLIILVGGSIVFWKTYKKSGFSGPRKWMCRIGLICGIIVVGGLVAFLLFAGLLGVAMTGNMDLGWIILVVILLGVPLFILNLVVTAFCWNLRTSSKRGLLGGILLTVEGLILIFSLIWPPLSIISADIFWPLSALLIASGILLNLSWWEGRRQPERL